MEFIAGLLIGIVLCVAVGWWIYFGKAMGDD
jgi:hypothetical protein